jgi:hypothetical protein
MSQYRLWGALLVSLVTTASLAQAVSPTKDVLLELNLPNGATPQLRIIDGGTGTVTLPGIGRFGFVPRLQNSGDIVTVDVLDLGPTPQARLGQLEVRVGGDRVQSKTQPGFGVRVVRIITQ